MEFDGNALYPLLKGSGVINVPSGTIAATTVQEAVTELDTEKQPTTLSLTDIGAGLADDDTVPVYDLSVTANRKSALSRFWTYITSKLSAYTGILGGSGLTLTGTTATDTPTLGAELLTTDGWTAGAGWAESPDDTFAHTGGGGTATLTHSATIANATKYQLTYTMTGRTAGTITITFGGTTTGAVYSSGTNGPTTSSTAAFTVTPTDDFNGTCVFSLKAITAVSTTMVVLNDSTSTPRVSIRANNQTGNQFIGYQAGQYCTTGIYNSASGYQVQLNLTTGSYNAALGYSAQYRLTTASYNTAIGPNAQYNLTTGIYNTGVGTGSQYSLTTGLSNAALGMNAQYNITTGSYNSALGYQAGRYAGSGTTANSASNYSTYIGYDVRASANGASNEIVIGNSTVGLGSNSTIIGNSNTTLTRLYGNIATGVDAPSAAIHALKTTEQLRLGYDAANYASFTVSNAGNLTLTNSGTTIYTDKVMENTVSGAGIILKSPDGTRYLITVANGGTLSVAAA